MGMGWLLGLGVGWMVARGGRPAVGSGLAIGCQAKPATDVRLERPPSRGRPFADPRRLGEAQPKASRADRSRVRAAAHGGWPRPEQQLPLLRLHRPRDARCGTAVVVLAADDVVLAQVGAVLHLDQQHRHATRVLDPVPGPARHVHGSPRLEPLRTARDDDPGRARDHHPVLGPEAVALQAQPLARLDEEALDLVPPPLLDGHEPAPGPGLEDADRGVLGTASPGAHRRITRAKSASTLLPTSSSTSAGTSSSSSSTTMARPRRVRRPTCMEAMLTLWRPRIDPIRPTMPGRSS